MCAGSAYKKLSGTGVICKVKGFASGLKKLNNVKVLTSVTTYDNPEIGGTVILIYPQSFYFGTMMETLMVPPN